MTHVKAVLICPRCYSALILIVSVASSGCGESSPTFPVPSKGYNTKRVEYSKGPTFTTPLSPRPSTAIIETIPRTDFSKLPAKTPVLTSVIQASPSQIVSYEGKLYIRPPVQAQTMILIECFQLRSVKVGVDKSGLPVERISRVAAASGIGLSRHLNDGESDYRVDIPAPKAPGKYEVEVSMLYAPNSSVKKVVAKGTLEVR